MVTTEETNYRGDVEGYSIMLVQRSTSYMTFAVDTTSLNPYMSAPNSDFVTPQGTNISDFFYNSTDFGMGEGLNATQATVELPGYIRIVSTAFISIVFIVGVVGNILVPIVILKDRDMRNSTNYFLMNLSVADLMVLLICLPPVLVELQTHPDEWKLGYVMCKYEHFLYFLISSVKSFGFFFLWFQDL